MCAAWLALVVTVRAQTGETQWRIFLEPKFMKPEAAFPIPNANHTVFVPGISEGTEVKLLSRAEFDALGVSWEEFKKRAALNAEAALDAMRPEFVRNKKRVITYATLTSAEPFMTTVLLAPGLREKFAEVFGAKILVVLPNRYAAYIFPALASEYRDYAPMVRDAYRATPYPVSLEVFEVSAEGIRAIGEYAPR